ncbi:protein adenylyltransferase SelO family protein, partial [bacterium]|nr:protein adenylyltransferase SelO family protein [bacterium]
MTLSKLQFNTKLIDQLACDPKEDNYPRQVYKSCYSKVDPEIYPNPSLICFSVDAAKILGLDESDCKSPEFSDTFSGKKLLPGMKPIAMCYGGHQFGNWANQLGDGRAIILGDITTSKNENFSLQLKGAGPTPYSRSGDGYAVLRSSIREFLCSEAMHYLGVPTTRALSLSLSGEDVYRDMMYDGNGEYEPGAIVCRTSPSFIRFGNFEILASRQENELLKELMDFTIQEHFPH